MITAHLRNKSIGKICSIATSLASSMRYYSVYILYIRIANMGEKHTIDIKRLINKLTNSL